MACRIAEDESVIQRFEWPTSGNARSQTQLRPVAQQSRTPEQPTLDGGKLAELQSAHQMELAQCRQAALEEGIKKGREAAANEIKAASDRLATTLRDLLALKKRMRSEAEADVVKLSLAIARRILHRELNADPESIQGIVYAGLQKLQNREISRVRIPPVALEPVRGALERAGLAPAVNIVADTKLRPGDILFETSLGELDGSVETQLQEIERGFADRLGL
ncbi:MAG TPA: FliH/SctL family protein [Bryobacteraceae bacterium]|jgi:flagellar assembly protein FliH|nr:FliH/SctL family protein [Bryobacteraceae bacterium]